MRKKLQKTLRRAWSASLILLSLSFLPFSAQSQCDYKIVGYDSWGDGWNGASIDVDVAGTVTNFTLSSGSIDSTFISSFNGDFTTFTFNSGSFDNEVTFDIYAPDGSLLGSYGPSPSAGLFLTDNSNATCTPPCDYKIVGYDSWGDGWNGASIDVDVAGAVTNFTLANGSIDSISITSYSGDITTFTFNSGTFDNEITFDVYAPDGSLLGSYGPSPSAGLFLTDTSNSVCTAPSCLAPLGLTLNNLGIDSASISWSAAGATPTNGFDYQLVPDGNGIGVGVVASGNSSSASQVITGLNGNTSYDFYVRSNCGSNDTSSYAGPLSFTTFPDTAQGVACSASNNSSILFSEEFDNNNAGWTGDINSSNGSWEIPDNATSFNTGADNAYSGSNYMNYEASSTSANSGSIVSPAIDLSTAADDAELSFWMHAYGASMGTLEIGVGTSSSGPFTTEFTWTGPLQTSGSDAWVNVGVDLSSYLGQTIYIQLTQHDTLNNLGSGYDGDMSIDLFEVSTCVGCAIPSGLTSTNITSSAADLNWTENGSATSWEISYGSPGFTPGAGTQTVVTNRPFSLSNLSSNTSYDWYVRAICGPSDTSAWSGLNNFTTSCPPAFTAPYSQNFDGTTDPNIDACWSTLNTTSSSFARVETENSSFDPQRSAPNSIEFYNSSGSGGELLLISPQLSDLDSTKQVAFYAQDEGSSFYTSGLVVGTMSDPTNAATFHPYDSIPNSMLNDTWQRFVISFDTLTGNDQYIAIGHDQDDTYDYIFLDDLEYTTIPTCPKPTNLAVGQITANDAQVTFTQGGNATDFNIAYGSTGFSLGSGTQVSVTNDTATLSGLSPQTSYDVYVRDSCAAGDVSQWVGPVTFTTACLPIGLPYSEDFTAGFPTCWTRSNSSDVIIDSACGINNSNYLRVDGVAGVNATTPLLDASSAPAVQATWSYRAACNNAPESGDAINVDYWNGSSWVTIKTYDGSTAPTTWTADTATVPGGNSDFQIRFDMQSGSGNGFDDYDFDSLSVDVSCTVTAPITESFDANAVPTCWSSYETSGGGWEYGQNGSAAYAAGNASERTGNGGYYAWIDFSGTDDSTNLETYEVDVSGLTTPSVAFDLFSYNTNDNSTNILYVEAWNGSNWVQADSLRGDLGGWQRQYVDLSSYTYGSNLVKVRFRGESGGSFTDYYNDLLIDEVTFDELPTCLPPSGLQVQAIGATNVTLNWTTGGASNWQVQYDTTGFMPGTGNLVAASNDTIALSGLSPQTSYDAYVRDSCGPGDVSTWIGPVTFTTACQAVSLPYSMNFATGIFPNCWSRSNTSDVIIDSACGLNNSNYLRIDGVSGVNATTPLVDASAQVSVKASWSYRAACNNAPESGDAINVDYWDGTQWITIKSYDGATAPTTWTADSAFVQASNADFQIRFDMQSGSGSNFDDYDFDSLMIEAGPSCLPSTNLQELSSTATSATVTWSSGNSSNWIVEYGTAGFTPGAGTTINATNDTLTISGLSTGTIYDFYVTDSCGAGNLSSQSGPGTFSTNPCLANAQCSYTLNLYDTWGDGWNGNEVDVFQSGISSTSFGTSFTSGDSLTGLSLGLCPNQTIDFILNEGGFSSEIEFFVINPAGDTVASHLSTSGLSTGDTLASFTTAPAANAGMSGSDTVCTTAGTVDLTSYLGTYDQGGTWTDLSGSGALTDSLFDASAVGSGTYNFTYAVSSSNGCSTDSASVALTVDNLNNAGADSSITACSNAGPVTLNNVVSTTGGSWVDLDNSGAFNAATSDFNPMASMSGSTFRFGYILSGGACPDDTAIVSVSVDAPANAGAMTADTLCDTAMVVDLNNYLDTAADAGGSWVDVNSTGALSGSDFDPSVVTPNATYDFRYVVSAPCGADSTTVSLYVDFCSSSIEEYLNGQVNLFPNPAQDVVNIETTGTLTNMAVTVYDAQGKALIRASVPTNSTKQLDVSALPAGMYTVSIQSDQGMAVKRFVKE